MSLEILIEMVNPKCFVIVARTHGSVLYLCPRLIIHHFEEVRLSMNVENIVELGRPTFSEIVVRPSEWLLYSFLTQIFLLCVAVEK